MRMESVFAPAKSTRKRLWSGALAASAVATALGLAAPAEAQTRTLNMQSSWPANSTAQEAFKMFADRVDKMTGGTLKITTSPAGTVVPAFEVLDATHKKVIDGTHTIAYYWTGKSKAATLFSNTPAGIVGMDQMDFIGWLYEGGGLDLYWEFYQKELKLNLIVFPLHAPSPQALGWFRKPITSLADFKGMKCRQTGITAELYARMGMAVVNMPGGEIAPAAERGAIDCAEWVGGIEDFALGLHLIWKNHYTPGMHEIGLRRRNDRQQGCVGEPDTATARDHEGGGQRYPSALGGDVPEAECRSNPGDDDQARRHDQDHAEGDQRGVPEGLGHGGRGRVGEEPVLQEGL